MRSRAESGVRLAVAALALSAAFSLSAQNASAELPVEKGQHPTHAQIDKAIAKVQQDPNVTAEQTIRTLKWVDRDTKKRNPSGPPAWLSWIGGLFGWIAQGGRVLVWTVAIILIGLLLVYIVRLIQNRSLPGPSEKFVAPSFVRDLDIRPESLPEDIGRAARELWDRGEHRSALALLYRGLLSRLVHVHNVPIRDSSTEGDCLALAVPLLNEARMDYASRLVRVWQRAVYGGAQIDSETVYALCDEFAKAMDAAAPAPPIVRAAEQPA